MIKFARLCGVFLLFGAYQLDAALLTYTVSSSASQSTYTFILTNNGVPSAPLFDLFVSIPIPVTNIGTSTIGAPVGWGDPTGGLVFFGPDVAPSKSFIQWVDAASGIYDLPVGTSLGGFSFTSSQTIAGQILFSLNGLNSFSPAQGAPQTVPEPATLPIAIFGWFALRIGLRHDSDEPWIRR